MHRRNPYSRRYYSSRGESAHKAGNAHTGVYGVWSVCAPHNWGEPILPEIHYSVKRGKVISLLTGARQATPTAGALGERTRPYGVWSICAHPITGVNPYSRRYCIPVKRGKVISPLDWCKAGNAHRRCPRRAHKTIRSVVYLCAPHNWGEPILPEILTGVNTSVKRGKVISLLTGARQATPTAGASESAQDHTECGLSVRTP